MLKNLYILLIFLIICFYFLSFSSNIFAAEWVKYPQNPVFTGSAGWDQHVSSPAIIKDNNKLRMWYQGAGKNSWSIGYAESSDGIHWQRSISQPVLIPKNETGVIETAIVEPAVVKTNQYQMWFNSQNNDIYNIRYAYSNDGINWTKRPGYVLRGLAAWEQKGVANPYIIFKDGKYLMWYMGWGYSSGWKIGYAQSNDGINWTKYAGNPLNLTNLGHVGGQSVIFTNNQFHMVYHTGGTIPDHIYHVVSNDGKNWSCLDTCQVLTTSPGFDSYFTVYPEIVDINSQFYLYYTGFDYSIWRIGLATEQPINPAISPLIIIPGLFASWNKNAIVYNQPVLYSDWKLNPFVKEYDGLKQTLINLGYQENQDFYLYPYDWRKDLNSLADDLNGYLNQLTTSNQSPITNFNLLGHSLGGLVGRIYGQKYGMNTINKLITVGSPHQGVAQVYPVVEAGELDRSNNLMWLAEKLLIQLYRNGLKSDKQIINEKIPVVKDLLPTNNFLINQNNQEINISDMSVKSDTLLFYNPSFSNLFSILSTIVGEIANTPSGYKIGPRTIIDQLLDLYPDGRPIENLYQIGDYTVLSSSARAGNNNKILNYDHGEIIYKKEAIKEILNSLALPYQENQIQEGTGTKISPSLLFLILSPAEMAVIFNNNTYIEHDGLILIDNAQSGIYQLNIIGKTKGQYQVLIGQVGENLDQWSSLYGSITNEIPTDEIDQYQINFDNNYPLSFPVLYPNLTDYFNQLINQLIEINSGLDNIHLRNSIRHFSEAKENYLSGEYEKLQLNLEKTHNEIFKARKELDDSIDYRLFNLVLELENIYQLSLNETNVEVSPEKLVDQLTKLQESITKIENKLLKDKNSGKDVSPQAVKLQLVIDKLNKANETYHQENYIYVQILLKSTEELIKEIIG